MKSNIKYRPDIDGMRAIAVLSVIIFHAFPGYLNGGFVGVDIFFVISGFLITNFIVRSINDNNFTFFDFYSRRIRRIFPALGLVLLFSVIIGWIILLPDEFKSLGKHIMGGVGFISNIVSLLEIGYFDPSAHFKPLLHLWSLGIEEQFYIIWPLFIYSCSKKPNQLFRLISIIFMLSIILYFILSISAPAFVFYFPLTRFWELMLGSILAVGSFSFKQSKLSGIFSKKVLFDVLSIVSFLLILVPLFFLKAGDIHSSFYLLSCNIGTALVIVIGTTDSLCKRILSNPILVFIGLISYPLYLWHWPLLSFANIVTHGYPPGIVRLFIVLVSFIFSWLTYEYLEKPIRGIKGIIPIPNITLHLCLLMFVIGISGITIYAFDGFDHRVDHGISQYKIPIADPIDSINNSIPTLAIIGDSHAGQLSESLSMNGFNNIKTYSKGSCLPLFNLSTYRQPTLFWSEKTECQPWVDNSLDEIINSNDIDYVIISAFYNQYLDGRILVSSTGFKETNHKKIFSIGLRKTVKAIIESRKNVILVLDVPELETPCMPPRPYLFKDQSGCVISRDKEKQKLDLYLIDMVLLKNEFKEIHIIDPREILCNEKICFAKKEGAYLYMADGNHLTEIGLQKLGVFLKERLLAL